MSPILYLAHPYSNDPKESFHNACKWTRELRKKDLVVFSPILHTHCYDCFHKNHLEDFVAWDLKLLEGFINHDGHSGEMEEMADSFAYEFVSKRFDSGVVVLLSKTAFKSGMFKNITKKLLDDLYLEDETNQSVEILDELWKSDGCRKEYEFAKSNHIRVWELESFLEGKEVEL